jgi:regulator of protease activity HflC (stomatin/prohibitin superfamily)
MMSPHTPACLPIQYGEAFAKEAEVLRVKAEAHAEVLKAQAETRAQKLALQAEAIKETYLTEEVNIISERKDPQ